MLEIDREFMFLFHKISEKFPHGTKTNIEQETLTFLRFIKKHGLRKRTLEFLKSKEEIELIEKTIRQLTPTESDEKIKGYGNIDIIILVLKKIIPMVFKRKGIREKINFEQLLSGH